MMRIDAVTSFSCGVSLASHSNRVSFMQRLKAELSPSRCVVPLLHSFHKNDLQYSRNSGN